MNCRPFRICLLSALTAIIGALLLAAPALAANPATTYIPTGTLSASFNHVLPEGLAFDESTGHIYVADSGTGTIYDFASATDNSPAEWNGSNTPAESFGGESVAVAVDNSPGGDGDVYVSDARKGVIDKFNPEGELIKSYGDSLEETKPAPNGQLAGLQTPAGSFLPSREYSGTFGIAVDQTTGDLYAIDAGHKVIDVFDSSGKYLRQISAAPAGLYAPVEEGRAPAKTSAIAIDNSTGPSKGDVYVADYTSGDIYQFDPSGHYLATWNGANLPDGAASQTPDEGFGEREGLAVVVEDSTGHLFISSRSFNDFDVFDSSGDFISPQITQQQLGANWLERPEAIAIEQSTGDLYIAAPRGQTVQLFKPLAVLPHVTLNPVSGLTAVSATLSAQIDPAGVGKITACRFEYISYSEYTSNSRREEGGPWVRAHVAQCSPDPTSSTEPTAVSAALSGLSPGTGYRYRILVSNENPHGTNTVIGTFTTVGRYSLNSQIGSAGSAAGQLIEPNDVAVNDSTGDLYIADDGNNRVDQFSPSGAFIDAWGWGVKDGASEFQICTTTCQKGSSSPTPAPGQLDAPPFVEVDNSSGASNGDIYVAENVSPLNERQRLTLTGATGGTYSLTYDGHSTTTTGTGDTVEGSDEITEVHVHAASGFTEFYPGEAISGPGIPPNTTVIQGNFGKAAMILSAAATETHSVDELTGNLPYNATAEAVQSALENLRINQTPSKVDGAPGGPYAIYFENSAAGVNEPQIEADASGLTPPTATAVVTTLQNGSPFNSRVQKFDQNGNLLASWGNDGAADFSAGGVIDGITVDNAGNLFVGSHTYWTEVGQDGVVREQIPTTVFHPHYLGTSDGDGIDIGSLGNFYEAAQSGVSIAPPEFANEQTVESNLGPGHPTGLAVDRATGDLYVDHGTFISQFAATNPDCFLTEEANGRPSYCPPSDLFGAGDLTAAAGLAFDSSTKDLYAADAGADHIAVFSPFTLPSVATDSPMNPGPTSATLTGTVNPAGAGGIAACNFEYVSAAAFETDVQTIAFSGATGGTFTLEFEGEVTPPIAYGASAHSVQNYLERLPAIGSENVAVGGPDGGPYRVEFKDFLTDATVPQLIANSSTLTPSGATATPATVSHGGGGWGSATLAPCEHPDAAEIVEGTGPTQVHSNLSGLEPYTTYHYRLTATASSDEGFRAYGRELTVTPTPAQKPAVDATSAADLTPTAATLEAQINPDLSSTVYRFRYGTTTAYGAATPPSESIGEDASDHSVSAQISALIPGTTYHFQAIAINLNGLTEGPDRTFDTPALPTVLETSTSSIGKTSATLSALLRPGFRTTTCHFEFGTGTAYGHSTPQSASVGADNSSHQANVSITGLEPDTTYHFRILATNEIGTSSGPDQTFTTAFDEEKKLPPSPCKKGDVLKHGKCIKRSHHKKRHHHRGGRK